MPRPRILLALLATTALLLVRAPTPARAAPPAVPVEVREAGGEAYAARLVGVDAEGVRLDRDGVREHLAWTALRDLGAATTRPTAPATDRGPRLRVRLVDGEELLGTRAGTVPDALRLQGAHGPPLEIPFEVVRSVAVVAEDDDPCADPETRYPPADGSDVAWSRAGDAYAGIVVAADEDGVALEDERGNRRNVAWADLLVLHLENDPTPEPPGVAVEVETAAGDLLRSAGLPSWSDEGLVVPLRAIPERRVTVPPTDLLAVRVLGARVVSATTVPFTDTWTSYYPTEDAEAQELTAAWMGGLRVDRRRSGCPLRLGGRTYRHGFAAHARSDVTLQLDGGYERFDALFGIDDEVLEAERVDGLATGRGEVAARVVADGRVLWEAERVVGGEPPRRVGPLDVTGVQRLELVVDWASEDGEVIPHAYVLTRATWAEPVLVRP